jgi:hypothetical protein
MCISTSASESSLRMLWSAISITSVLGLDGIGLVVIMIERSYFFTRGCSFYIAQIIIGTIKEIEKMAAEIKKDD